MIIYAQQKEITTAHIESRDTLHNIFSFSIAPAYLYFQDAKFLNFLYSTGGGSFQFDYSKNKKEKSCGVGLSTSYTTGQLFNTDDSYYQMNVLLYIDYFKKLSRSFSLGGRIDLIDIFYHRKNVELNNPLFLNIKHTWNIVFKINFDALGVKRLSEEISYGLFSFMKEIPSFGFSIPQKQLENGEYNSYDDISGLASLKYFQFVPFWDYFTIRINTKWDFSSHVSMFYHWQYSRQILVGNYTTLFGVHLLGVTYSL